MGDRKKCPKQKNNRSPHKKELKDIDEMEETQIPAAEFKIMVIRILKDHRGRTDDLTEKLKKEIVSVKKDISKQPPRYGTNPSTPQ